MELEVTNVRVDDDHLPQTDWEMVLRFVGVFVIRIDGEVAFREVEFPFVEIAEQVAAWLQSGATTSFEYTSMESGIEGIIYFHPRPGGQWEFGSNWPSWEKKWLVSSSDLLSSLSKFVAWVPQETDRFGVDVRHLLEASPDQRSS